MTQNGTRMACFIGFYWGHWGVDTSGIIGTPEPNIQYPSLLNPTKQGSGQLGSGVAPSFGFAAAGCASPRSSGIHKANPL